jgi:hypothetical protein
VGYYHERVIRRYAPASRWSEGMIFRALDIHIPRLKKTCD